MGVSIKVLEGGLGSGNHGHNGRPGLVGGSLPYDTTDLEITSEEIEELSQNVNPNNNEIDALDFYTSDGFEDMNAFLRGRKVATTEKAILNYSQHLDSYISKFKPLPRDIVVYRATNEFPSMSVGTEFIGKAFVSTSASENFLSMNRYSAMQKRFKILIPKGTRVAPVEGSDEEEIILPRNSKFKVLRNEDGIHVDLEVIK